jgi:opacity protein-like surface antigen
MRRGGLILLIIVGLAAAGARQPARATAKDQMFNLAVAGLGTLGFTTLCYYFWKNSPAERAKGYPENLGPGEWYLGGYTGLSYLPPADWKLSTGFPPPYQGRTARHIVYQPAILGGIKFGRYFDSLPWFGVELEMSFSRQAIHGSQGRISPPLPAGPTKALSGPDRFYIWAMQCNLLARYGFLKDKEVNFGRLQPYVGLGPGFEVLYGTYDSAKNFAIEAQAGIRYMFTEKIALFCEYKFSYQFGVEYQNFLIAHQPPEGTMMFDVPHHRFILGISYHFKNLYGN